MRDFLLVVIQLGLLALLYHLIKPISLLHFVGVFVVVLLYGVVGIYRYEGKR